jgi:hypothetical protein
MYRERITNAYMKTIDTSKWTSANYFVSFKTDTGKFYSRRLAILH